VGDCIDFSWDDGLEGPALEIAGSEHSPFRVVAGPGVGKTFTMMRRVARLLQEGVNPRRVYVGTFTRTAAQDLQAALGCLGVDGADRVRAGTLHSLCFQMLSRNDICEVIGRVARPMLDFEVRFLLEDLSHDDFGGVRDKQKRLLAFSAAWARLQSQVPGWPADVVDRLFQSHLRRWLTFHRCMLIGEVVPLVLGYLRDNPLARERAWFQHVLVDEYQDLNRAEQNLLDYLASEGTLTVIGDEDQSIYSFKHAHPQGISHFEEYHPETKTAGIEVCRRCPTRVIEMANSLIAHNEGREERRLLPFEGNPEGEIHIVQWTNLREEAEGVARYIKGKVDAGEVSPGKVLVLTPSRYIGYEIRDALNADGVSALSFFTEQLLEGNPKKNDESKAQQAYCLLKLLVDGDDAVSLRCWCGFGSPSLNQGAWNRLVEFCTENMLTPREALSKLAAGEVVIPNAVTLQRRFALLMERLAELQGKVGQNLIDTLFPSDEPWADPFRYYATSLEGDFEVGVLADVIFTEIIQPDLPTDVDFVRIMSLHKSKGLTADLVVVAGCVEGLLPRRYEAGKSELSEEEFLNEFRRLFYVAITRATSTLVISYPMHMQRDIAHKIRAVLPSGPARGGMGRVFSSRFIENLGPTQPAAIAGRDLLGR